MIGELTQNTNVYARRKFGGDQRWEIRPFGHWFCDDGTSYHTFELNDNEFVQKYELCIDDFVHLEYKEYDVFVWKHYKLKNNETKLR